MVKDLNTTVNRWQRKVQGAGQDYVDGVANPGKDWQSSALQAEQSYNDGVMQSIQQRDWANGVAQVSTQEWQRKTLDKSGRWAQGVQVAGQDYANKMSVVLQNVEAAVQTVDRTVGPRGPKGSEQNINRSVQFQREMHARTLQSKGVGAQAGLGVMEPISVDQFGRPMQPAMAPSPISPGGVMEPISVDQYQPAAPGQFQRPMRPRRF